MWDDVAVQMVAILGTMLAMLWGLVQVQYPNATKGSFLPCPTTEPSKHAYEVYVLRYSMVWMTVFGVVVVSGVYERFDAWSYIYLCGGLALGFVLQPFLYHARMVGAPQQVSPDVARPWYQRYSCKANVWIAVYSFIGNYWYTHYFYSVLHAAYTMPSIHRFNHVPIPMYLATHFYFSSYHCFSNMLLRNVETSYRPGLSRTLLLVSVVVVFSYFTAFMETFSISSYPYYTFQDRTMAYTVGSAFYGIYFLVSFPAFYVFDRDIDKGGGLSLWDTVVQSLGYSMMILCLLDFVRLHLDIPLVIGSSQVRCTNH
jgi:cycloeucalenol cycloisomerase